VMAEQISTLLVRDRDLGVSYKTAFVLCHKMRAAMAVELKGRIIVAPARKPRLMAAISAATSSRPT
jgi:hypothetical protein